MASLLEDIRISLFGGEKTGLIDLSQPTLLVSAAAIAFNPVFWNIVARQEFHTHFLTRTFRSPYYGCYFLALVIFGLGIFRDYLYERALNAQPLYPPLQQPLIGYGLLVAGNVLVLSSMWALGVTGTYLGDYFGILMDEKVQGFPFSVTGAPMYWGSTCSFLGWALVKGKVVGLVLTVEVCVMYCFALRYEDPFTEAIYAKREKVGQSSPRLMARDKEKKRL